MKKVLLVIILGLITIGAFAAGGSEDSGAEGQVKIGFVVKDAQEPWFLDEWKFAEVAAEEMGFALVKIGASDGEQVISALDNLGAQQAQGVIICVPDVNLGTSVVNNAKANNLKLMTVDDRLLDYNGSPIEEVPHMGISAYEIGKLVGSSIYEEIAARGWNPSEVYAIRVSFDELPTAKARTDGATDALLNSGFLEANIIDAPQKYGTEGAFDAANIVIAKSPNVKKWVMYGLNDEAVLGAVRALEGNGFSADDMIGVGIGGSESGLSEFRKESPTGFFGTVIISPKRHGYETALNMYNWIANGTEPQKLIYTTGELADRDNFEEVRANLGLN